MLQAILNKSWRQHPTKHQLYGPLPPITKTIKNWRTRHAGHCWRSRDEPISDVLLCTTSYDQAKAGRPARTFIQQLCEDTRCSHEDLPETMNDREEWRERVRDIRAGSTTWWRRWYNQRRPWIELDSSRLFPYEENSYIIHTQIYHHHHHVVQPARISLNLSWHPFLSFIAPRRSSRLQPVSAQSCCI